MRRARTADRPLSSALLLLIALLFAQLCVHGQSGLRDASDRTAPGGAGIAVVLPASDDERAPAEREVLAASAGEPDTESAWSADTTGGSCPERQAPDQSGSPHLAMPAAAEAPSPGRAAAPQAVRWPAHRDDASAASPPPHVCVLRI
ncbi:hypothetical protein MHW47_03425 [Streptomyces sp. OfavH-34-F]|uniref:hypothetical protein n=1 Tax=Streptomyces sp. OfavH-34-F TaxID=2917760 RepID=UPI001EF2FB9C|nr:hypothetical protein [Streptomyces sp. OfavH-34-F]MCG7523496.1 hypothetical protein [Streptomyces sp. OfavH-34-F]